MGLLRWLCPDMVVERIYDLEPAQLQAHGIKALLLDLDNTLTEWQSGAVDERTREWVERAKASGLRLCICSNSSRPWRVRDIAGALGIEHLPFASKPNPRSVQRALELVEAGPGEGAVVGDQLFTDILGGKLAGTTSIWVRPLSKREFIVTRLVRALEGLVIRALRKHGMWPEPGVLPQRQGGSGADTG